MVTSKIDFKADNRPTIRSDVQGWWVSGLTDGSWLQLQQELTRGWVGNPPESPDAGHPVEACCLGVLTGVAIAHGCPNVRWNPNANLGGETQVQVWLEEGDDDDPTPRWVDFSDNDLPRAVEEWAFVGPTRSFGNPSLDVGREPHDAGDGHRPQDANKAIALNDQLQLDFAQIAELVKALPVQEVKRDDSNGS